MNRWFAAAARSAAGRWTVVTVHGYATLEEARACRQGMELSGTHEARVWPADPQVTSDRQRRHDTDLYEAIRAEVYRKYGERVAQAAERHAVEVVS